MNKGLVCKSDININLKGAESLDEQNQFASYKTIPEIELTLLTSVNRIVNSENGFAVVPVFEEFKFSFNENTFVPFIKSLQEKHKRIAKSFQEQNIS